MFLTREDIERLTGKRQHAAQIRTLTRMGIPHYVSAKGRPVVVDGWDAPRPQIERREPFVVPTLDREATFRPMNEIRCKRMPWFPGIGPDGSGVYFLFARWELSYIGQSVCVGARLRAHVMNGVDRKTRPIPFNRWTAIEVPKYWLDDVERYYISKHRPPFNIRWMPRDEC